MIKIEEETGKIYGCYQIIEILPVQKNIKRRCICKCINCGNIREMSYDHVKRCCYKKCPKCNYTHPTQTNLVGEKFGRLTVIERVENKIQPNKTSKIQYLCKCDCGNQIIVNACHLKNGHTTSCGCYHKEKTASINFTDLTGKKYGRLTVLYRLPNQKETTWLCQCECGKTTTATTRTLNIGGKQSCGCLISKAEEEFETFLCKNGFEYCKQYKIEDCKDKRSLPFDFAVFVGKKLKCLVELNGQQHYGPFTYCNEDKKTKQKNYTDRKRKDTIKENYCINHNIPLLIIKYTQFSSMDTIFIDFYNNL